MTVGIWSHISQRARDEVRVQRLSTATRMISEAVRDRSDHGLWGDTIRLASIDAAREIAQGGRIS